MLNNVIEGNDLRFYIERVVSKMTNDDFAIMQTGFQFHAGKIRDKINAMLDIHREKKFIKLVEGRDIKCHPVFKFRSIITPTETHSALVKSLYESEATMNSTERKVIEEIVKLDIRWWHRITERKEYSFYINGFINHYPDFIVMTNKGNIVVVEVKGDDRDNSDSERKLRLGREWAKRAGERYEYYMVFDNLDWNQKGAYRLAEFIELMKKL